MKKGDTFEYEGVKYTAESYDSKLDIVLAYPESGGCKSFLARDIKNG